jgi:cytosine/adenosine deaminase-related metal-dependent hydrolase
MGKGDWADFLKARGIDYSSWNIPCESPVEHLDKLGVLDSRTLAVHLIHCRRNDVELLEKRKTSVCLCLRSNESLHGTLPPVERLMAGTINLCLGTDSLASVDSLSMTDEMRYFAKRFPQVSPSEIFRMATENGAQALGFGSDYGRLEPGKSGRMVFSPDFAGAHKDLFERLVS